MKFAFYGGAREVGRSCVCLDGKYLFDAGLKISEEGSEYPLPFDLEGIQAVFLSHAHLDHSGALPLFYHRGLRGSVFCNPLTKDTTKILLKDSFHIELLENREPEYKRWDIADVMGSMVNIKYNKPQDLGGAKVTYLDAGHIPGSASVLLEYAGKRILYTGDINSSDTRLLEGLRYKAGDIDILICESTYGDRDHPKRGQSEGHFLQDVEETLKRGGSALVPAFAVGRAQEILMILDQRRWDVPIYLDGMAKKFVSLLLRRPGFVKKPDLLSKALQKVTFVRNKKHRKRIMHDRGIFVTTSGMLDGGSVLDYLQAVYHNEKSALILTGYQAEGSNGRLLLDEGRAYIEGLRIKIRCMLKRYDFSAHSGQKELISYIRSIKPKQLILMHGKDESAEELAKRFNDIPVTIPRLGDEVIL